MSQNLVVQLLLKTGTFSTDLKQARGQVQNFQKGCQTAGKSLSGFTQAIGLNVGALAKFGGAAGAAVLAGKAFKSVIEGSQTTSDKFEAAMYSAKNAVKELASAVSTFDFSSFNNGLSDMIDRGIRAAQAIDQLGNTIMSYNVKTAKARAKVAKAKSIIYNPDSTKEEIEQAKKDMKDGLEELKQSARVLISDYETTIIAEVNARGANLSGEGAINIIDKWLEVDTTEGREAAKKAAKEGYDAFTDELKKLNNRYTKTYTMPTTWGATSSSYVDRSNPEYQKELKALNDQYKDQVAYHVLLEKYTVEELQNLGNQRVAMINIGNELDSLDATSGRLSQRGGVTGGKVKEEIPVMKESLTYWEKIAAEAKKLRDAQAPNTEKWNEYNDVLTEALNKITDINKQTEVLAKRKEMAENPLIPITNPITAKAEVNTKTDIFGKIIPEPKTQAELQNLINLFENLKSELKEGDPLIATYNQKLEELKKRLAAFNTAGVEQPEVKKETINSWDEFNKAMANTSTIVSSLTSAFSNSAEMTAASVLQMVATCLPAIGSLISAIGALTTVEAVEAGVGAVSKAVTTSKHWIEAIAAVASLGAVVAAAIAAARRPAMEKFATGGIVGGSSFTGDRVSAQVNSGEMILTKAQQARLFRMANGEEGNGGQVTFHISGTDLIGVLDNNIRKQRLIG